jgi:predicted GNAT family acetyltransferase
MEGNWYDLFQDRPIVRIFVSSDLCIPIVTEEQPVSCVGDLLNMGVVGPEARCLLSFKAFICNHTKVKHFWRGRGVDEKLCLNLTAEESWFDS